jgi:putative endonuclease
MRAPHLLLGQAGENLAIEYLQKKGYRIEAQNVRLGKGEIDLIAWEHPRLLVFIEVKTRRTGHFGGPEEAVTVRKQKRIARTAGLYMEQIGYEWAVRFDVIAIVWKKNKTPQLQHFEDAFFWM